MDKTAEQKRPRMSRKSIIALIVILFIWFALASGISLYIDGIWFDSLGYWQVFSTIMTGRFVSFLLPFLLTFAILWTNGWISSRCALGLWTRPDLVDLAKKGTNAIFLVIALAVALLIGVISQMEWLTLSMLRVAENPKMLGKFLYEYNRRIPEIVDAYMILTPSEHRGVVADLLKATAKMNAEVLVWQTRK